MRYDPFRDHRRTLRLRGFDYSSKNAYFITICTQEREFLFETESIRRMLYESWIEIEGRFANVLLDAFVIMPNHIHGIIFLTPRRGEPCVRPIPWNSLSIPGEHKVRPYNGTKPRSIGRIIQAFKSTSTLRYSQGVKGENWPLFQRRLWQRNYYEHIIRNDGELNRIRQYIRTNPLNWDKDPENPNRKGEPCVRPERLRPNARTRI